MTPGGQTKRDKMMSLAEIGKWYRIKTLADRCMWNRLIKVLRVRVRLISSEVSSTVRKNERDQHINANEK
jgi:hypothetical protein